MEKKTIEIVGLFTLDSDGKGKIEILPDQGKSLPFKDGDRIEIIV